MSKQTEVKYNKKIKKQAYSKSLRCKIKKAIRSFDDEEELHSYLIEEETNIKSQKQVDEKVK